MRLRPVTRQDSALLLQWRNDPGTRQASLTEEVVSTHVHETWLAQVLGSRDHVLYVGESEEGIPLGMIRFERLPGQQATVSLVIAPDTRGRGYGTELLRQGCAVLRRHWDVTGLQATVKMENVPSYVLFKRAGFQEMARVLYMRL